MMKSIVVYYSRKGENYVNGSIESLPIGNTEIAASMIQELTGSDIFKIETVKEYSASYLKCIKEAKEELRKNARPGLKSYLDLDGYDVVYLGYPNWWGTMPMALFSFLEHYDLGGKTIYPFCTNEGSGMGSSERDLKRLLPTSIIKRGLSIHGAEVKNAKKDIQIWLKA